MVDPVLESAYEIAFGEHADRHSASDEYAARFAGKVGNWFLEVQSEILRRFVSDKQFSNCLDVGGGHAQVVSALCDKIPAISVLISAPDAACQLEKSAFKRHAKIEIGKLSQSALPAKSYQLVTCFRIVTHSQNWQELIAELCRLAQERIIIDYPPYFSSNLLEPLLFAFKKQLEGNTRKFLVFKSRSLEQEFAKYGFTLYRQQRQFVFPMVLHRALKNLLLSRILEGVAKFTGLTFFFGSPCIAEFRFDKARSV